MKNEKPDATDIQRTGRILIVDDDKHLALSLINILKFYGYQVEVADSLQSCREKIKTFEAQVALLDIRLGDDSGIELITPLNQARPGILCVMMTAYATINTAVEALHQGAYDYLQKPVDPRYLLAILERCFEKLRLESEKTVFEEALSARNYELELLNRAGQTFVSILDLDQVLITILEEVRCLLDVAGCSIWLIDPETDELICQQAIGVQREIVQGWRLAPGKGVAGWVARHGESLIVPDTRIDERHFKEVDQQIGVEMRSILTVSLRVKQKLIGALSVVDSNVDRFGPTDLTLVEALAATAAIAIENARLYEAAKETHRQAQQDAETKATLLNEIDHRVKNNLTAIIGLLHMEQRHTGMENHDTYQAIMEDLINRIRGLATVHGLLSASQWTPLLLSELTNRVIHSTLRAMPFDKRALVDIVPSPVWITPNQANSLALVVNELTTNTIKYALLQGQPVHITVAIDQEDDNVFFEFRDNGPGYPKEVLQLENHNVGVYLIRTMVNKGLSGEVTLHNDQGAVTAICFRATVEP